MRKILLLILILAFSLNIFATEWRAGDFKIELTEIGKGTWSSSDCLKSCELLQIANDFLKKQQLSEEELSGGKNPGSVICRKVGGTVIYMSANELEDAFCQKDKTVISLDRFEY